MQYGREIQCYYGANVTIQNSTFYRNHNGVYCFSASPTIQYNAINDVQYHGIICKASSSANIFYNTISKDDEKPSYYHSYCGIWLEGSSPYIAGNTIQGFNFGVYPTYGSNPEFTDVYLGTPSPNNTIQDNHDGIAVSDYSNPRLGEMDGSGAYNSILANLPWDVVVSSGCTVYAQQNWWGYYYTPVAYVYSGGNFYWYPPLTSPPGQFPVAPTSGNTSSQRGVTMRVSTQDISASPGVPVQKDEIRDSLMKALLLRKQKQYGRAQEIYKKLLAIEKYSQTALAELADMFNETKDDAVLEYFKSLRANPKSSPYAAQNGALISALLASMHRQNREFSKAKQLYDDIIVQYPGTSHERHARFQKFYLALHVDNDKNAAAQLLNDITSRYAEGYDVEFAKYLLSDPSSSAGMPGSQGRSSPTLSKESVTKEVPQQFELSANYPNPFNPSTTIRYAIAQNSFVTLKVFDVLGKEITTLVNEEKSPGYYDVQFNAPQLSSGIYFYQIQAGSFSGVKKMLLIK